VERRCPHFCERLQASDAMIRLTVSDGRFSGPYPDIAQKPHQYFQYLTVALRMAVARISSASGA
jgi:hypothetical protein